MDLTSEQEKFLEENLKAEEAITNNNLSLAAQILVSLVEKDPQNWRAYNNMGILAWLRRSWHDAYTMFTQSVSLKPDYSDALLNLFDAALKLKRVNQILPFLERASKLDPDSQEIKIICESISEHGEDIYFTPRALSVGAYSPLVDEGTKELEEGNFNSAMDKFLASLEKEGPNAPAFCGLGIIAYHQRRYEDAYTLFTESIKLNPLDQDTFMNLLDTAQASGMELEAYELFNIYKLDFPSLEPLTEEFEKMHSAFRENQHNKN